MNEDRAAIIDKGQRVHHTTKTAGWKDISEHMDSIREKAFKSMLNSPTVQQRENGRIRYKLIDDLINDIKGWIDDSKEESR
jgi:predicted AAA+ superfamily ATPase